MIRYESVPPPGSRDGAAYQLWLRRRIAKLENMQAQRIVLVEQQKRDMDATVERAQRELENLKAQQTIGVAQ